MYQVVCFNRGTVAGWGELTRSVLQSFYVCLWGLWITFAVHYVTGEIWQSVELIGKESFLKR